MEEFNGYIGSSDATHIAILNCATWDQFMHKGYRLILSSRTYKMIVDHSRWILGFTIWHPATWNDKTLILYNQLICGLRDGNTLEDFEFKFYERDEKGEVACFIADNRYLV